MWSKKTELKGTLWYRPLPPSTLSSFQVSFSSFQQNCLLSPGWRAASSCRNSQ